jgi:hypothetical protein
MHYFSVILILFILAAWLYGAISGGIDAAKIPGPIKWLRIFGFTLMAIGAVGFFGSGVGASGGLNWLPPTFEWPVGSANGVIEMPDHEFVVPLQGPSRVQVYDQNLKFLRGWQVSAGGGVIHLTSVSTNQFKVTAVRGHKNFLYKLDGSLDSQGTYELGSNESFARGETISIPTPWWFWPFEGPFHSWLIAIVGLLISAVTRKNSIKVPAK